MYPAVAAMVVSHSMWPWKKKILVQKHAVKLIGNKNADETIEEYIAFAYL